LCLLAAVSSRAEPESESATAPQAIAVEGGRDPLLKPYGHMIKGLDAFEQHHALAPAATLRFVLVSRKAGATMSGLRLSIFGDAVDEAIPLSDDGSFSLPRLADADNADLVVNRKKGDYGYRILVRSPGLDATSQRLGDLRLMCQVQWAITKPELGFAARAMLSVMGNPCESERVGLGLEAPSKDNRITLSYGDKSLPLTVHAVKDDVFFWIPAADKAWPDDALIRYSEPAPQVSRSLRVGMGFSKFKTGD
jgi:hypothetical protein